MQKISIDKNPYLKKALQHLHQFCQHGPKAKNFETSSFQSLSRLRLFATLWTIVHGILQARILEWVAFTSSRGSSQPRDRTQVSHTAVDSLRAQAQGKPKNTEVGSLSLLQRIFTTQESNQGLLHCKKILYQLIYQGSWYVYVCYQLVRLGDLRELIHQSGGWLDAVSWDSVVTYIAYLPIC